jgi:hypothetical protein
LLQPGNEVTLQVNSVTPPPVPGTPLSLPPLGPNQIAATVTGTTPQGQIILRTDAGAGPANPLLFVKANIAAQPGSTVTLTVTPAKFDWLPVTLGSDNNIQALQQALSALGQLDPQMLRQVMEQQVPQPTQALPGALLFFLSALKQGGFNQGNVRGWLGDEAVDRLTNAGKGGLVARLAGDMDTAGQTTLRDPVIGEWRAYPIPLHAEQQLQSFTLHVHQDGGDRQPKTSSGGAGKVRFLIDLRLSRLGSVQLDGFVHSRKLEMIVRTESPLPSGVPTDMRSAYLRALNAVNYTGGLNFQVGWKHWVILQQGGGKSLTT